MKSLSSKKGVSPLIATVLLIAFAVALGVVVMNWGKDYVETTAKDTSEKVDADMSCQMDIELKVKEIGKTEKICYNNLTGGFMELEFMLENTGRNPIQGIRVIAIDENDEIKQHDNETFAIGAGSVSEKYNLNTTLTGSLQFVEFIPLVEVKGKVAPQPCTGNTVQVENIRVC